MKSGKVAPIIINRDTDGTFDNDFSGSESMRSSRSPKQSAGQAQFEADSSFARILRAMGAFLGWKLPAKKGKKLQGKKSAKSSIRWTPRRDDR
jgi:hypothetical protein